MLTSRERWTLRTDIESELKESYLSAQHDNNNDINDKM